MAESSQRATGTPNTIYDLSSVLYHTLQAGASYDQYIRDAEDAGDQELAEFFGVLRNEDSRRADYAQELIAQRTPTAARMGESATSRERVEEGRPTVRPTRTVPEDTAPPRREEAPPAGREERPREREGQRGLVDEVRDRLLGPQEERGRDR